MVGEFWCHFHAWVNVSFVCIRSLAAEKKIPFACIVSLVAENDICATFSLLVSLVDEGTGQVSSRQGHLGVKCPRFIINEIPSSH